MKQITKQEVIAYLKEKHGLTHHADLFSKTLGKARFNIINDVCKHFTKNWIENGMLHADDPERLLLLTYVNYNNFDHITDIDIFIEDLNQMVKRKEENLADFQRCIDEWINREEDS